MRDHKTFILILILATAHVCATAQTKMIAHRSHSGKDNTFSTGGEDNFGISVVTRTDSIIKISSSLLVQVSRNFINGNSEGSTSRDTMKIKDHPYFSDPNVSISEIKNKYPAIKFIGFEKIKKQEQSKPAQKEKGSFHNFNTEQNDNDMTGLLKLSVALFSLLMAYFIWKSSALKQEDSV